MAGRVAREHVQVPQGHAGGEAGVGGGGDGGRELEQAEVGHALGAHAHADELDLGEEEAVAGAVLAHAALQVRQALQVLDLGLAELVAHARVPAVEGLDEADDAAAAVAEEGLRVFVGVGRDEVRAVGGAELVGAHRQVRDLAHRRFEGGVEFGGVEVTGDFQ